MQLRTCALFVAALGSVALLACGKATYSGTSAGQRSERDDAGETSSSAPAADEPSAASNDSNADASNEPASSDDMPAEGNPSADDPDAPVTGDIDETGQGEPTADDATDEETTANTDTATSDVTSGSGLDAGSNVEPNVGDRLPIPGRVEAEDFARYNEQDIDNDSGDCGPGPVDLGTTNDDDGECFVGWTQGGEWLEYDVWAESSGQYTLSLRLASDAVSDVEVLVDDGAAYRAAAPAAGWDTFVTVDAGSSELSQGAHVVRVRFVEGQVNLNYLVFTLGEQSEQPLPSPEPDAGSNPSEPNEPSEPTEPPLDTEGCGTAPQGYSLVWSDTFDYEGLPDPERWGYETGGDGFGNNELQYYTESRAENARVEAGVLTLTAIYEEYMGNAYTSAKLNSGLGASTPGTWNEGVFSIRAKLPQGLGTWPALWMMPTDCAEGWPNCGEIDVMESVGYDEGVVHGTIHTDAFNHVEGTQIGLSTEVADATSAFHTYTLIWTSQRIEWQVDGDIYHSVDRETDWGFAQWPFDEKAWHLMINLAVGGDWGGAEGVDSADYPATFEVDSVCVYQ
jgi:beta-glucanase (GH16 family)